MKLANNLMHQVDIQWGVKAAEGAPLDKEIQDWVAITLEAQSASRCEVAIRVVSSDEIQALNFQYRQKAMPTNVLSFPMDAGLEDDLLLLGDIAICQELVIIEAKQQAKTLQAHFAHMVIHGVLHLLGFDHIDEQEAEEMEQLEVGILHSIGVPNPYDADEKPVKRYTSDNGVPR